MFTFFPIRRLAFIFFSSLAAVGSAAAEESPSENEGAIILRSWIDAEVMQQINQARLESSLAPAPGEPSLKLEEHGLNPGQPVKQLAFTNGGQETFALLKGGQTLVQYQGELPLKESARWPLTATTTSMIVLRDYLVLHQKTLNRLEFRKLSDLEATYHWKPTEGHEIRGIGLSPEQERAPLVIWTRSPKPRIGYFYHFEFLDSRTFEKQQWKVSGDSGEESVDGFPMREQKWEGNLEKLQVSDDGRVATHQFFTLSFGRNFRVDYQPRKGAYWENSNDRFRGRKLPYPFSGFKVLGFSENHVFIAGPRSTTAGAVLDRATLVPLCLILGWTEKIAGESFPRRILRPNGWVATLNEAAGHLHLRKNEAAAGFVYHFDPSRIREKFPFQSCASHLPFKGNEVGMMKIPFAADWQGEGHQFRLLQGPPGSSIDPSSGEVSLTVPVNQAPGSELLVQAEGRHASGTTILFQTMIAIP